MLKQKHPLKYKPVEGYRHVGLDDKGVPYIKGTATKVVEIVIENIEYKWDVEQLHIQHPHLGRAQICSALSYYWDHKDEIDADIERRMQIIDELHEQIESSPLATRLKSEG